MRFDASPTFGPATRPYCRPSAGSACVHRRRWTLLYAIHLPKSDPFLPRRHAHQRRAAPRADSAAHKRTLRKVSRFVRFCA